MKPYIICHMASSIDGRILPERWTPNDTHMPGLYDDLHERLGGGSWLVGRVTGAEFAKRDEQDEPSAAIDRPVAGFPRTAWLPDPTAGAYAIVLDAQGRILWGRSDIGGDPLVVVLTRAVPDAHLAELRADGVGYVFAGDDALDPAEVMTVLSAELGIERLLLEGGGHINGGFLRAGLVDEISLMLVPAIDGAGGAPTTFDGADAMEATRPPLHAIALTGHEVLAGGIVWLRYRLTRQ